VGGDYMKDKKWKELIKECHIDLKTLIDTDKDQVKTQIAMAKLLTEITKDNKSDNQSQNKDR